MVGKYFTNFIFFILLNLIFFQLNVSSINAQFIGHQQQEVRWIAAGSLRSWFSNFGAEVNYNSYRDAWYEFRTHGLIYLSEYFMNKGISVAKSLWIGTTDFHDTVSGTTYPYKVVCIGPREVYTGTEIISDTIMLIGKYNHPETYTDYKYGCYTHYNDFLDNIDETQSADRTIINKLHTSIGISVARKVMAFSQQYHDNYFIYEYVFKNTGNKTLKDVIFYWQYHYEFAGESYREGWSPQGSDWGRNTISDVIGQDTKHPGNFRAFWAYYGPSSKTKFTSPEDEIGLPGPIPQNVRIMAGTQFAGVVVLHADKSPHDQSDDIKQPITTQFVGADDIINKSGEFNESLMSQKYIQFMNAGHPSQTHAEQVGKDVNGYPISFADLWGIDAGGYMPAQGFGPYTLEPGDSIRIVLAEAVAGLSRNKNREVAKNWFENNTAAFVLPDGTTTLDRNGYKNAWVFTGKDSLFRTFKRALYNFNNNYNIPQPPPPPNYFTVNSGGWITLNWKGKESEAYPNFNGYRLYRAQDRFDTTYELIFECNKHDFVNSFIDKTARPGFDYYYYLQAKDDGSTNTGNIELNIPANEPLVSSKYFTMTNTPVFITHLPGEKITKITGDTTFIGDGITKEFILSVPVTDSDGNLIYGISVSVNGVTQIPAAYTAFDRLLRFIKPPLGTVIVKYISNTGETIYKLSGIRIVPNPYNIKARNIQFDDSDPATLNKLAFYNLPPACKIRIYTELGDLIETLDHTNGSGDEYWYLATSSRQLIVSGLYIAHFEVTEDSYDKQGQILYRKGDSIFKKFIVVR